MVNRLIIIVCFVFPLKATAQVLNFGAPEKLSGSVNTESEESMPLLSPDGKLLYFIRSLYSENVGGQYTGHDIWMSERLGSDWRKADNKKNNFNNKGSNGVIGISTSGDVLYLMDASSSKKVNGIYFSRRENNTWTKPELVPVPGIESNGFLDFYMAPDFDVLFISMKGRDARGEEDIYVSLKGSSGQWSQPKNLGPTINTAGFEISPFLSSDKKHLYFSSNGHPGQGDADIFVSERLYGSWDVWSAPQNLSKVINSDKFDAYFSIYGDSVCFFSSSRNSNSANIYQSKIKIDDGKKQKERIDSIMVETTKMLNQLRSSTSNAGNEIASGSIIFYQDNSSFLTPESDVIINKYIEYLKLNGSKKIHIKFDGKAIDSSKNSQILNQDRIRKLKQFLKSFGIVENRIVVSSDFFNTDSSSHIVLNSFQLLIE